jgi:multiple sugar transport system permease protein
MAPEEDGPAVLTWADAAHGVVVGQEPMDAPAGSRRRRRRLPFSPWHLLLMPTALLFILPLVWMLMTSFMSDKEINVFPPRFIPSHIDFGGYTQLFGDTDIVRWTLNTTIVTVIAVLSHMVLCSLAGYGFARLKFDGRNMSFFAMIATIMIPIQLLMIPTFVMFSRLRIIDTLAAAFVPWLASAFGIFLMRQFFLALPIDLEDAGRMDGCNRLGVFWHIVLPLARPALATLAVFTLLGAWNDLIWPLIAISNEKWYTIQLGLTNFQGTRHTQWQVLMAGNVIATLPLVAGFVIAQRQFVETMTFTAVKG